MQQYIDGVRVANSILMLRRQHSGAIAVVEGLSDVKFYDRYFDKNCRVFPALGKPNVLGAMVELEKRKAAGVLGIVDCDYSYLEKKIVKHPNIVITDFHDLEVLLLLSPSLLNVLRELIPDGKTHLLENLVNKVRETLFNLGAEIGYLRWVSVRENLGLNFDPIPYSKAVDPVKQNVDLGFVLSSAKIASKVTRLAISDADILSKVVALKKESAEVAHICQGHDLIFLLEFVVPVVFDNIFGRNSSKLLRGRLRAEEMGEKLRLGYEQAFFVDTNLYLSIKDWEKKNPNYVVVV